MKYGEHRDKLYPIEERERFLIQLIESLRREYKDENKGLSDKIDCLQSSQIYIHNHINQVERAVDQIQKIILG
jgi:hypothetical protein